MESRITRSPSSQNCDPNSLNEVETALSNAPPTDSSPYRNEESTFPSIDSVFYPSADTKAKSSCTNSSPDVGDLRTLSFSSTSCSASPSDASRSDSTPSSAAHRQTSVPCIALPKHPFSSMPRSTPSGSATDRSIFADGSYYAPIEQSVFSKLRKPLFRMIVSESGTRCLSCQIQNSRDRHCYVLTPVEVISPAARKAGTRKRTVLPGKLWLVFLFQRVNEKSLEETTHAARLLVPLLH